MAQTRISNGYSSCWQQTAADVLDRVRVILSRDPNNHAAAVGAMESFMHSLVPLTIAQRECGDCRALLGVVLWEHDRHLEGEILTVTSGLCDNCFDKRAQDQDRRERGAA